ncbi:hypothetical protein EYZ11_012347 [Aspergillus tanneri]|uniref:Uncharacterized protein n=1 Tax=Aspergillus tanneri TaxID=1220188 RepID=A0A4S3J0G9_9EURO|nr:hypothetical protein EYZ11_012347 [Aspergillus tanneri]
MAIKGKNDATLAGGEGQVIDASSKSPLLWPEAYQDGLSAIFR